MATEIGDLMETLHVRDGWPVDTPVEHGIETYHVVHEFWLTLPPVTWHPRVVVFHPLGCGCDALPDQVTLHG